MSNVRCFDISIVSMSVFRLRKAVSRQDQTRPVQSVVHNGKEFWASNVLARGGRTNHFCSVSCEIKRLLIVFINQFDHQRWSAVQQFRRPNFVTKLDSREERCSNYGDSCLSLWMSTCLNSAGNSCKWSIQEGSFTRPRITANYDKLQPINLSCDPASQPALLSTQRSLINEVPRAQ